MAGRAAQGFVLHHAGAQSQYYIEPGGGQSKILSGPRAADRQEPENASAPISRASTIGLACALLAAGTLCINIAVNIAKISLLTLDV
jgi:hypothetical protein